MSSPPKQILEYQSSVATSKSDTIENYLKRRSGRSEASSSSFVADISPARSSALDDKKQGDGTR